MRVILATDSFKGCLTSQQVEAALAVALQSRGIPTTSLPMSDGGDGMLQAFAQAMHGTLRHAHVHDPLMRPVKASYAVCADGTAIIETAQACGLSLMEAHERNPLVASTYGVGEILLEAIDHGSRHFIIGLGGSGTSDCGRGMLSALATRLTGGQMELLPSHPLIQSCQFTLASDVRNPLYGPQGAAHVYGRQKGATPVMQEILDRQAQAFALHSACVLGYDKSQSPGSGAAGGLGYAFMQYLGAEVQSGAHMLLQSLQFPHLLHDAHLVITGEGSADQQTLMGKLPMCILQQVRQCSDIPVWLIAGRVSGAAALQQAGFQHVESINPPGFPQSEAMKPEVAIAHLTQWVAHSFR